MRVGPDDDLVLDRSVVMVWVFEDEDDPYALEVLQALRSFNAVVPPLWMWEVTNVLSVGVGRKRITEERAQGFLQELILLEIKPVPFRQLVELPTLFML